MKYDSITDVIGGTPLVRIDPAVHGLANIDLYAKLEMLNPFGSVKDRSALNMAAPHLGSPAQGLIELSSGNTAKALSVLAGMHGLRFKCVTNRMKVPEIKDLLLFLGAEIEELPGQAECLDPTNVDDPLTRIHRELSAPSNGFRHTDQYFNPANVAAHENGTGPEIIADLAGRGPDYFIAGVGTAGSATGVANALRHQNPEVTVVGLIAQQAGFVPGIRNIDEVRETGLFDPATFDTIEAVSTDDAVDGMLSLARRCGILAGPTGGAAYVGAVRYLEKVSAELDGTGERRSAVFIVCDRAESYLSYVRRYRPEILNQPSHPRAVHTVSADEAEAAPALDVAAARDWIAQARPLIVDLRGTFAFQASHIAGSINITDDVFDDLLRGGMPFGSSTPVLLACPIGQKSARYAALLARSGYQQVRSLAGGIIAWRDAGASLVRD